jgi:gamma-glutamyltranspeptidase/glutathione hydrolase
LLALNILEQFDVGSMRYHSAEHLHLLLESLRLAFADSRHYVCDPLHCDETHPTLDQLLSKKYAAARASHIDTALSNRSIKHGMPANFSNTVYFATVDAQGNACSFINSNYEGFGTGLIPNGIAKSESDERKRPNIRSICRLRIHSTKSWRQFLP